jgi:hypothetical protein
MAKVTHDDPQAACSWGGQSFSLGADGTVEVPDAAVAVLAAHGFRIAPEPAPQPPPPKAKKVR